MILWNSRCLLDEREINLTLWISWNKLMQWDTRWTELHSPLFPASNLSQRADLWKVPWSMNDLNRNVPENPGLFKSEQM